MERGKNGQGITEIMTYVIAIIPRVVMGSLTIGLAGIMGNTNLAIIRTLGEDLPIRKIGMAIRLGLQHQGEGVGE